MDHIETILKDTLKRWEKEKKMKVEYEIFCGSESTMNSIA